MALASFINNEQVLPIKNSNDKDNNNNNNNNNNSNNSNNYDKIFFEDSNDLYSQLSQNIYRCI